MPKIINVYLSGPMYLGKEQAFGWRKETTELLLEWTYKPGNGHIVQFNVFDPCERWFDDRSALQEAREHVVKLDKMEIEKSNVVIVNATSPGWGTPMEQYIAYTSGKMVIAFSECKFPSIWAVVHSHRMCSSHVDAAHFLCSIAFNLAKVV